MFLEPIPWSQSTLAHELHESVCQDPPGEWRTGNRRSVPGALAGSVVGTGVGLGVHYLLNQGSDRNLGDKVVVPIFALAQGMFAAWGSRVAGR
jgi:hypothetical protein